MSLCAFQNGTSQVSEIPIQLASWCMNYLLLFRLKISVTAMTHSQAQNTAVEDKWTEIIEDLWEHLPHFQDEEELYDDHCLKFDCVTLQFGDGEESDSDSETWLHQNTSDMEDSFVEVESKEECELKCIAICSGHAMY